jgi:hypothetical protein
MRLEHAVSFFSLFFLMNAQGLSSSARALCARAKDLFAAARFGQDDNAVCF